MKAAFALVVALAALAASAPTVDDKIAKTLSRDGLVTVIVTMANSQTDVLREAFVSSKARYTTRGSKLNTFYNLMKGHADEVQAGVLSLLQAAQASNPELRFEQIWVSNQVVVRDANAATIDALRSNGDISEVHQAREFPLEVPRDVVEYKSAAELPKAGEQWGVLAIEAEKVHAAGNTGAGAVVANIDTGVRVSHEALRDGYRREYGWYDPAAKSVGPNDGQGHGTHTMGTIVGRAGGIGVAPGAQWIACKGCGTTSCSEGDLLACGNWIPCPTDTQGENPNCDMAPHVSSNSWGGGQGDTWYSGVVESWRAVDILPLFSSGNSGPTCGTANSPADSNVTISIGATQSSGALASFSSVGPAVNGLIKPDVAAPGQDVISASSTSDTGYRSLSGTSMACPHTAGLSALLYSVKPDLTVDQVFSLLTEGAKPHVAGSRNCGGVSESTFPNNAVGYGVINAVNSVAGIAKL